MIFEDPSDRSHSAILPLLSQALVLSRGQTRRERYRAQSAVLTVELGPTFRKVKAVHFSSSVPSGDSMRPTKHAFQISNMKSGEGMRCRAHRQTLQYPITNVPSQPG